MIKEIFLSLTSLAFLGCSTVSQEEIFDGVKKEVSTRGIEHLQWIKTQKEADSVNESVNALLASPLSQENAVRIALINNRALQQTYEQIGLSQSDLVQAGLMSNPLLGYSYGRGGGVTTSTWSLDVAFLDLLWIPLRRELGGLALEETKAHVGNEVLKTARDVRKSFIDARVAQEQVALYESQLKSYEASVQLAMRQTTAGNLSKRSFLKIQDTYSRARLESIRLNQENGRARETLNRLLGVYGTQTHYTLEMNPLKLIAPSKTDEGLERYAIEHRLDMRAAIKAVDYAASEAGYAKDTRLLSEVEISAESEKTTDTDRFNTFGIKIPIPIFDFGQGRVGKTQAMYNQSVHRLYEAAVNIRSEVREAYAASRYAYDTAYETYEVIVPANKQILEETQLFYNGMLDGIYELLEDQRRYGEARMESLTAIGEYQKAQADLEYVLGGLLMEHDRRDFLGLGAALLTSAALARNANSEEKNHYEAPQIKRQLTLVKDPKRVLSPSTIITPKKGKNYNPVVTLNGWTLPYEMKEGVKEFHLIAEPVVREFAPGMVVNCWGYNGTSPGPTIEAVEGDRVRLIVTNKLPEHTTIHWHGLILPNGMDGVGGLTQPQIAPGETFIYEFTLTQSGTFMYHPHADEMVQMAMGAMGMFIIHPKNPKEHAVERDFCFLLASYDVAPGTYTPNPSTMTEFNLWTFNSRTFPGIDSMNVRVGDRVRIRVGNLTMTNHPIHMHGHTFEVTCTDGGWVPKSARWPEVTVDIGVGQMRAIEFTAKHEGDWAFHCHKSHHTMGPMGHNVSNMIGVKQDDLTEKISDLMPDYMYMPMGKNGMAEMSDMADMGMQVPENTLPMMTGRGPFGPIEMGGMFTLVKVRKDQPKNNYSDQGWYEHPAGSVAKKV